MINVLLTSNAGTLWPATVEKTVKVNGTDMLMVKWDVDGATAYPMSVEEFNSRVVKTEASDARIEDLIPDISSFAL